jgi:hypothetical protein
VFYSKILPERKDLVLLFSIPVFYSILSYSKKIKDEVILLFIFILVPLIGYFAFQGNYGNIYDYYMTGYYFPLVLLFSIGLRLLWESYLGKTILISFLIIFFSINFKVLRNYLGLNIYAGKQITFGNEVKAVDWVLNDTGGRKFNVNIYVPPVIPYSYDYLFLWRGNLLCKDKCGYIKDEERKLVYIIYEEDLHHPWRLEGWLKDNEKVGVLEETNKFGGITVQRRIRI